MNEQTAVVKQPVMSWAEVRAQRENGVPIPLASVPGARLRHLSTDALLLRHAEMPAVLSSFVLKALNYNVTTEDFEKFLAPRETPEAALDVLKSLEFICKAAFVSPRIVDEPQGDGEISIEDVTSFDRGLAFRLAFLPADVLRNVNLNAVVETTVAEPVAEPVAS